MPLNATTRRRNLVITERLRRLPVWGHPALRVRFDAEGFDGYVFGCRAGPEVGFKHLFHELGHAVQFGPETFADRCTEFGHFRFGMRQVEVLGESYPEPLTRQCTAREAEVFASNAI